MSDTRNVLLVEDDSADALMIQALLSKAEALAGQHFEIERVSCFRAAIEVLSKEDRDFDAVLLDRELPDSARSTAIGELRELFPALPIVVLTGLDDPQAALDAVAHGAQDYLVKGRINPESLARVLNYAITRQRLEQVVRDSETEHRALFDLNPVPIWVYDLETLHFLEVNAAAQRRYGWTREEFLGMRVTDICRPESTAQYAPAPITDSHEPRIIEEQIARHRTRNGREILAKISAHAINFRERSACLVLAQDVTETLHMVTALKASEQRYRELFEMSLGLICEHTLDGRLLAVNPAAANALGYEPSELIGVHLAELVPPRFRNQVTLYLDAVSREGRFSGMMTVQRRDGQWRAWRFHNRVFAEGDAPALVIGHAQDVTEELRHEQELHDASLTDPLTGARNRRYLDYLTRGGTLSDWGCVIVDLDHFKQINDTHGHERGDEVLIGVVEFLKSQARQDDVVVRMGGDEFLVLLCDSAAPTAAALTQRIAESAPQKSPCNLSLGWAVRIDGESLDRTIGRADQQLYELRRNRRGKAVASH